MPVSKALKSMSPAGRLMRYVSIGHGPDACWTWKGAIRHKDGYGAFAYNGRWLAHRFSYLTFRGEIPEELELDHLCRNRACCNPYHLEPVTRTENIRRGDIVQSVAAHCRNGHRRTEANTIQRGVGVNGQAVVRCRDCRRATLARYDLKKRARRV